MVKARRIRKTAAILWVLLALIPLGSAGSAGAQSSENHAGLVLQFADGSVRSYCIPFSGESIAGLDLLLKTGLEVKVESYAGAGALICKIGPDGCDYPEQPCVCESYGPGGIYWSYHHLKEGSWKTSGAGISSYRLHNGDVDGLAWSAGKPPPLRTFSQVCTDVQPHNAQATAKVEPPATTRPPTPVPTKLLLAFTPAPPIPAPTEPATIAVSSPVINSTPMRTATTPFKARSTATVRQQGATPSRTSTPQPPTATPVVTPTSPSTPEPTLDEGPTGTSNPRPSATRTVLPTDTAMTTVIPAATRTAIAPSQQPEDAEGDARNIAIIIGSTALVGLAALGIWRGRWKRRPDEG